MAETTPSRKKTTRSKKSADTTQDSETSDDATTDETESPSAHVTSVSDGVATITTVDSGDSPGIARRLLDAADFPDQVRTTTAPHGWKTPEAIAKKAGLA